MATNGARLLGCQGVTTCDQWSPKTNNPVGMALSMIMRYTTVRNLDAYWLLEMLLLDKNARKYCVFWQDSVVTNLF